MKYGILDRPTGLAYAMGSKCLLIASMKNEGPFILEWVAWHRALGFEILIYSNDCDDGTDEILARLAAMGEVVHVHHKVKGPHPPKPTALAKARKHPIVATADWVMLLDVDEFLVLKQEKTRVQDWLASLPPDITGVSVHWRVFGTGNMRPFKDKLVHQRFRRCAARQDPVNRVFKSIFKAPGEFGRFGDHGPSKYCGALPWGDGPKRWVNNAGYKMNYQPFAQPRMQTQVGQINHRFAQINHYVLRSLEDYSLKRRHLSASALKNRYTKSFFDFYNRNEAKDHTATRSNPACAARHDMYLADPTLSRLHHGACAMRVAAICDLQGVPLNTDPRWTHHLAFAGSRGRT